MLGLCIIVFFLITIPLFLGRIAGVWARRYSPDKRDSGTAALIIAGCCVTAMFLYYGVDSAILGQNKRKLQIEQQHWPSTQATITAHRIRTVTSRNRSVVSWLPVWTYSYQVERVQYSAESEIIKPGGPAQSYTSKEDAARNAALTPEGSRVTVYYDPKRPETSFLNRPSDEEGSALGLSLLMFLLAAPCIFLTSMAQGIWSRKKD
ncbi:DUF3592 domain-containing protein [Robbsia sp. KACC 23696]|uniref:DUF3592 domain-containing protein n=1 Tax=Robbsia sp. KACC 23696 TaxID=3149231 RepID=UPI00325AA1FD